MKRRNWTRLLFLLTHGTLTSYVSAQLVQANAQAYLSFGAGKGKGKHKGKAKVKYTVRPSHLSLEDRRRRLKDLAKTECRACGRKGHWTTITDARCLLLPHQARTRRE